LEKKYAVAMGCVLKKAADQVKVAVAIVIIQLILFGEMTMMELFFIPRLWYC
jgi:hypothetical protein